MTCHHVSKIRDHLYALQINNDLNETYKFKIVSILWPYLDYSYEYVDTAFDTCSRRIRASVSYDQKCN